MGSMEGTGVPSEQPEGIGFFTDDLASLAFTSEEPDLTPIAPDSSSAVEATPQQPDCSGFWGQWGAAIEAVASDPGSRPAESPYPDLYGADGFNELLRGQGIYPNPGMPFDDQAPQRINLPKPEQGEIE